MSYLFKVDPIYQSIWICFCILPTAATYLPTYPPICQSSVPIYVYVFVYIILWKKSFILLYLWKGLIEGPSAATVILCNTISRIHMVKLFFRIDNSEGHGQVTLQSKHAYHCNSLTCVWRVWFKFWHPLLQKKLRANSHHLWPCSIHIQ